MQTRSMIPAVVAGLLIGATAQAQESRSTHDLSRVHSMFAAIDTNSDSKVDAGEAARNKIPAKDFAAHDVDADRAWSQDEFVMFVRELLVKAGKDVPKDLGAEVARITARRRAAEGGEKDESTEGPPETKPAETEPADSGSGGKPVDPVVTPSGAEGAPAPGPGQDTGSDPNIDALAKAESRLLEKAKAEGWTREQFEAARDELRRRARGTDAGSEGEGEQPAPEVPEVVGGPETTPAPVDGPEAAPGKGEGADTGEGADLRSRTEAALEDIAERGAAAGATPEQVAAAQREAAERAKAAATGSGPEEPVVEDAGPPAEQAAEPVAGQTPAQPAAELVGGVGRSSGELRTTDGAGGDGSGHEAHSRETKGAQLDRAGAILADLVKAGRFTTEEARDLHDLLRLRAAGAPADDAAGEGGTAPDAASLRGKVRRAVDLLKGQIQAGTLSPGDARIVYVQLLQRAQASLGEEPLFPVGEPAPTLRVERPEPGPREAGGDGPDGSPGQPGVGRVENVRRAQPGLGEGGLRKADLGTPGKPKPDAGGDAGEDAPPPTGRGAEAGAKRGGAKPVEGGGPSGKAGGDSAGGGKPGPKQGDERKPVRAGKGGRRRGGN